MVSEFQIIEIPIQRKGVGGTGFPCVGKQPSKVRALETERSLKDIMYERSKCLYSG